ncbi:MAG TPA: hypothetical protein VJV74_08075 [Terriglobia bacterium]|nr:hypothetical protein [Terriglobia bacterium]
MPARTGHQILTQESLPASPPEWPLWQLDIQELAGHNIEARGREVVNQLLEAGWILLHLYTLKYEEGGVWRERPMAILGRPRGVDKDPERKERQQGEVINPAGTRGAVSSFPVPKKRAATTE